MELCHWRRDSSPPGCGGGRGLERFPDSRDERRMYGGLMPEPFLNL